MGFSGAMVQQLSALQGLTHLVLDGSMVHADGSRGERSLEATPAQLAAMLQPLTALQCLQVHSFNSIPADTDCTGVAACVKAVCGLPALSRLNLRLPVRLDSTAQQELANITATQLLHMDKFCVSGDMLVMFMK